MAVAGSRRHTVHVSTSFHQSAGDTVSRTLREGLARLGLAGRAELEPPLMEYLALLAQWNRTFNLTAVRDPEEMVVRHLLDSLAVLPWIPAGRIADIGTGAGLPGIPLALALPDRRFTLVDSVGKKVRFLRQACRVLPLENVTPVQCRLEDYRPEAPFDAVIARALALLDRLGPLAAPLLQPGGLLLAMSGRDPGRPAPPTGFDTPEVHGVKVPHLDAPRHLLVLHRTPEQD